MDARERETLLKLALEGQVAALSVLVEGKPYAGLVPFVMKLDGSAALIHASGLARHTLGLGEGAPFALLVHEPEGSRSNPQQLARVALHGSVRPLDKQATEYAEGREIYLSKYPKSRITFGLGDFRLYELQVETARFVAGFASAHDVGPADLATPASAD